MYIDIRRQIYTRENAVFFHYIRIFLRNIYKLEARRKLELIYRVNVLGTYIHIFNFSVHQYASVRIQ